MGGSHRREQDDPAGDLFDRWMSHHAAEPRPAVRPTRAAPAPATPAAAADQATPVSTPKGAAPASPPAPRTTAVAEPAPARPARSAPAVHPVPPAPRSGSPVGLSTNVDFTPRTRARTVVGWLLFVAVLGLVPAGFVAADEPTTLTVGVAGTLLVLVLLLWAIRAASPVAHLRVRAGQLEVVRGGDRFVLDLGGAAYTPIEVVGTPGERRWKVLFMRGGLEPFVVDGSMVDAREFMDVLRRYRPR